MTNIKDSEYIERYDFEDEESRIHYFYLKIKPGKLTMDFQICERRNPEDALLVYGHLKWDGCMNWSTHKQIMYHYCDIEDAEILLECFKKLYELGEKYIERWDF